MTPKTPLLVLAAGCLALLTGCASDTTPPRPARAVAIVDGATSALDVQVTDGRLPLPSTTLMDRPEVVNGSGLLYTFTPPTAPQNWGQDTLSTLDVAWIRNGTIVGTDTIQPCTAVKVSDCGTIAAPAEVDSALEAPAGTFAHVARGAHVTVTARPSTTATATPGP